MKVFWAATAVAFALCTASALADGTVTVHVVDSQSGKPVSGVPVALANQGGERDSITDRHGSVLFLTVPDGRTRVAAAQDAPPYYVSTCIDTLNVAADQNSVVTLEVVRQTPRTGRYHPHRCTVSTLVQPGVSADVYDIF